MTMASTDTGAMSASNTGDKMEVTKNKKRKKVKETSETKSIGPSEWTYLLLELRRVDVNGGGNGGIVDGQMDELTVRMVLQNALQKYLGVFGAAIDLDILLCFHHRARARAHYRKLHGGYDPRTSESASAGIGAGAGAGAGEVGAQKEDEGKGEGKSTTTRAVIRIARSLVPGGRGGSDVQAAMAAFASSGSGSSTVVRVLKRVDWLSELVPFVSAPLPRRLPWSHGEEAAEEEEEEEEGGGGGGGAGDWERVDNSLETLFEFV